MQLRHRLRYLAERTCTITCDFLLFCDSPFTLWQVIYLYNLISAVFCDICFVCISNSAQIRLILFLNSVFTSCWLTKNCSIKS